MILTAVAILTNLDVNFDQFVAQHIPNVNLTASLECSSTVTSRLHEITGRQPKFVPANGSSACGGSSTKVTRRRATPARRAWSPTPASSTDLGDRPGIHGNRRTGSTRPGDAPLTLASLRGRVVLIDFWTYTCINCIRTLPYLKAWDAAYRNDGLTIVGVETPEFPFEHEAGNVANAIAPVRPALPRRAGQQHGHLERVRQRSTGPPTT